MDDQTQHSDIGPIELSDIRVTKPQNYAAGMGAVKVAMEHVQKEMGLTRGLPLLSRMNQKEGFDCPGCAWPDPDKPSKLGEYCENGAKALAEEATLKRANPAFFQHHSVAEMSNWTDYEIGKSGRLTDPVIRRSGATHYEALSWLEAYEVIDKELKALDDPNEGVFYTSGRSSNEAAFLFGLFIRAFGTNNMPDCSNMCHESSGVALKETLGIGKGSVTLEDFDHAEIILVIGQNPGTNHPRMLSALERCKKNGGKIIAINPLAEAGLIRFKDPQYVHGVIGRGTSLTDLHLPVKINQDVALMKLIIKRLARRDQDGADIFDHEFIQQHVQGYDELLADLERYDDDELLKLCGVSNEKVHEAVNMLASKSRIIACWAMGLTQHKNGVDNIRECVNLLLLKGSIAKRGAGTCPVRGHSNVQGDRTVGITHHVSKALNDSFKRVFDFEPPSDDGMDTVKSIQAMYEGRAKVFMALGGNFLSASPDTAYTAQALRNCSLTLSISTKLNRTHLVPGKTSIILPTLGRSEVDMLDGAKRFVTVENSMGKVHRSQGSSHPASDNLKSEPEIIATIAAVYFSDSKIEWGKLGSDYDYVRCKISDVFKGFDNYKLRSKGSGFYLPNNSRSGDFSQLPNGRAQLSVCKLPNHKLTDAKYLLMTIRSHDQFNTTIYGMNDRYRGIYGERRVLFMNASDMKKEGLLKLNQVDLISRYDNQLRKAQNFLVVPYDIPSGNLAAYFPETNVLVPYNHYADKSNTPISKSIEVDVIKIIN